MLLDEKQLKLLLSLTCLLFVIAIGVVLLVMVYRKRQMQFIIEKKQLQLTYEKEILESKLEIQEQTMKHIAEELHDNIGQMIGLIRLNINSIKYEDPQALREKIDSSANLLKKVIQDLRDLSKSMHADHIKDLGLMQSIENHFDLIKKAADYQTSVVQVGEPYILSNENELILFRVFQEAVNNIVKHAKATIINVTIEYADRIKLEIADNGKGFDSSLLNGNSPAGLGLRNMRNRAKVVGGDFDINSENGKGTVIRMLLPV